MQFFNNDDSAIHENEKKFKKKRVHHKSTEEYLYCKEFVLSRKEVFDLKKIALFMLRETLHQKKSLGLNKMEKNLKFCKRILDYYQRFENSGNNDPTDDYFLTKNFSVNSLKNLNIIYRLLLVQTEILLSRFETPQKPTIQLLNYAKSVKNFPLEIECACGYMDQLVSANQPMKCLEFAASVLEKLDVGVNISEFSDPQKREFWVENFKKNWIAEKFQNSTEKAQEFVDEQLRGFSRANLKKTNIYFAIRILDLLFLPLFIVNPALVKYRTFAMIHLNLNDLANTGPTACLMHMGLIFLFLFLSFTFF